jgi:SAM-dependent methyltransferase
MDAEQWRAHQRRLRAAIRVNRRSSDGQKARAQTHPRRQPDGFPDLTAPDLLRTPIVSERQALGQGVVAIKELLRRLLSPFVLEPQTRFNQAVVQALAAQRDELAAAKRMVEEMGSRRGGPERFDYLGFEERFRGSAEVVESRQAEYLDYFAGQGPVLDVGCGRGELLTLLRERGIEATGVDSDPDMVASCRERGLSVECADGVDYLERQADGSLGGVFLGQLVEHMSTEDLVELLAVIKRKTADGAVLIVETLNPESMPVLMRWFWLDPTHVRLVHPETLQYLMEQAGFGVQTVQFRQQIDREKRLPVLELPSIPADVLAAHNDALERANERLFGAVDYFVVGLS